jgi:hypothetical protein
LVQARGYFERALTVDPGKLDALLGVGGVEFSPHSPDSMLISGSEAAIQL